MFLNLLIQPIYNCFILILGIVPGGDVGIAIAILTVAVRAIFYPLFTSSIRTQMAMQAVQPELAEINEKYKDNTVERGRRTSELFKRHRIHPLTSVGSAVLQLVIFIGLSYAFFRLGLPHIRTDLLYPFVPIPQAVNEQFLGVLNLTLTHNSVLTVLVFALQYLAMHLTLSRTRTPTDHLPREQEVAQEMQRKMMLWGLPVVMAVAVYFAPAAVGLYFLFSNLASIGQELLIRRKPL